MRSGSCGDTAACSPPSPSLLLSPRKPSQRAFVCALSVPICIDFFFVLQTPMLLFIRFYDSASSFSRDPSFAPSDGSSCRPALSTACSLFNSSRQICR